MEDEPIKRNNTVVTVVVVIAILGLLVGGALALSKKDDDTAVKDSTTSNTASNSTSNSTPDTSVNYKDGNYTADGEYTSPGGNEKITVTITVAGNKITDSTVKTEPADRESSEYQKEFTDNYKSLVVGKLIDGLNLNKVSGSSLTSQGFNDALEKIRTQAKA